MSKKQSNPPPPNIKNKPSPPPAPPLCARIKSDWDEGYKAGYRAGAEKALKLFRADKSEKDRNRAIVFLMTQIDKVDMPVDYSKINQDGCVKYGDKNDRE